MLAVARVLVLDRDAAGQQARRQHAQLRRRLALRRRGLVRDRRVARHRLRRRELGREILEAALMEAGRWQGLVDHPLLVSVNLSARQLQDSCIVDDVRFALSVSGVPAGWKIDILGGGQPVAAAMPGVNQDVALPHIKAGKMRAIAVSSAKRNPLYPDTPTIAEAGYKDFEALSWSGMSVAKGTPQPIVDKLEAAISQAMQSEAIRQRMSAVGFIIPAQGGKPYSEFLKKELEVWTRVIKTAGIKPQ